MAATAFSIEGKNPGTVNSDLRLPKEKPMTAIWEGTDSIRMVVDLSSLVKT